MTLAGPRCRHAMEKLSQKLVLLELNLLLCLLHNASVMRSFGAFLWLICANFLKTVELPVGLDL